MKFFFVTRQEEGLHRPFMGAMSYRVQLTDIFVLAANGGCYFCEMDIKSSNLISTGDRLLSFLQQRSEGEEIDLIGYGTPLNFVALTSLFGSVNDSHYPAGLPKHSIDLLQTVIEYMELLDDDEFGIGTDYMFIAEKDEDQMSFTQQQKFNMFISHKNFPTLDRPFSIADEAYFLSRMNAFVTEHRLATTYKLKLPLIRNEDDNRQ